MKDRSTKQFQWSSVWGVLYHSFCCYSIVTSKIKQCCDFFVLVIRFLEQYNKNWRRKSVMTGWQPADSGSESYESAQANTHMYPVCVFVEIIILAIINTQKGTCDQSTPSIKTTSCYMLTLYDIIRPKTLQCYRPSTPVNPSLQYRPSDGFKSMPDFRALVFSGDSGV